MAKAFYGNVGRAISLFGRIFTLLQTLDAASGRRQCLLLHRSLDAMTAGEPLVFVVDDDASVRDATGSLLHGAVTFRRGNRLRGAVALDRRVFAHRQLPVLPNSTVRSLVICSPLR